MRKKIKELKEEIKELKEDNLSLRQEVDSLYQAQILNEKNQEYILYLIENGKKASFYVEITQTYKEEIVENVYVKFIKNKSLKTVFIKRIIITIDDSEETFVDFKKEIIEDTEDFIVIKLEVDSEGNNEYYQVNKNDNSVADITRYYEKKKKGEK